MAELPPPAETRPAGLSADPKRTVFTFVLLTFAFSSVFWYLITTLAFVASSATMLTVYTVAAMWCPAIAAVLTRLLYQRNLRGFGFGWGSTRWELVGIFLPIAVGLVMFGIAWISGIAPFNTGNAAKIFALSFLPSFLTMIAFNFFAASGEELGWRGLLVPELSRFTSFTTLALVSGAIWTVWHFPLIFFSTYHGTGPIWYSLAVFIPSVMGAGLILAWLRLVSGSVWPCVFFHGFWNYFIQQFYPALTVMTDAGQAMLGEFGWFGAVAYVVLAVLFWWKRDWIKGRAAGSP